MNLPKDRVLAALAAGSVTRREIVASTELNPDLVDLIVDVLISSGEINLHNFQSGCRTGSCRGCLQSIACNSRGAGSTPSISLSMPLMPS